MIAFSQSINFNNNSILFLTHETINQFNNISNDQNRKRVDSSLNVIVIVKTNIKRPKNVNT